MDPYPLPFLVARVFPPLTVRERPVVAQSECVIYEKSPDGRRVPETRARGRFYRSRAGRSRTDILTPRNDGDVIAVSILWDPDQKTTHSYSFSNRVAHQMRQPTFPGEHRWMPRDAYGLKFSDERKTILELECQRVYLSPLPGAELGTSQDEIWVSKEWGLVMLDVAVVPAKEVRWEVVRLEKVEPDPSVFEVPGDFKVIG